MVSSATAQVEPKAPACQCPNAARTGINYMASELAECQPTRQDYEHTLEVIGACSEVIREDPRNGVAYRDRALALAFLGRDQESRQDSLQAAYAGLDHRLMSEEVQLVRKIAIDCQHWDDGHWLASTTSRGAGLVSLITSLITSLFGR